MVSLKSSPWVKYTQYGTEISYVLYAHELMCALMTRKSCAVGMRNAILRNYLKRDNGCPENTAYVSSETNRTNLLIRSFHQSHYTDHFESPSYRISLGYLKDTKFYFENKASFTLFLLSGSGNSALFGTVPWLA